jgi:hypothetical protein
MPHIVQEYCHFCTQLFIFRNGNAFSLEHCQCIAHEVVGAQGMLKAGVYGPGINQVCKTHLLYTAKALVKRIPDHFQYQWVVDGDKSINRVIDDFLRACVHFDFVKRILYRHQI